MYSVVPKKIKLSNSGNTSAAIIWLANVWMLFKQLILTFSSSLSMLLATTNLQIVLCTFVLAPDFFIFNAYGRTIIRISLSGTYQLILLTSLKLLND